MKAKKSSGTNFWNRYKWDFLALLCLYLLLVIFFSPVVFQGGGLAPAADMVAAAGMNKMGEEALSDGRFPLWNPTLFSGLPMFASLQYALFCYPPEYFIRVASYIFGASDYRIWLFHYLLAGIFMYLLARHFRCGRLAAWFAGAAYAFSPQLIVLAEVGHGSKLMGMTYLPLIWLMLDRLRIKPAIGRAAALGAVFAVEILSLHPQVAAYGALLMGLYILYYGVSAIMRKEIGIYGRLLWFFGGAMLLALALSAVLWVSVLDFARFSIRGAGEIGAAGGGLNWDYATGWSFHPLESITFLFPNFMGFGGQTYWGTVWTPQGLPFTHTPMYFGCIVLMLAVLALALQPRSKWGFPLTLGLAALALSFGKYLPVLYGFMYYVLPLFNKFRAPVMGQVLLMLSMALLAGVGLEAIIQQVRSKQESKSFRKVMLWVTVGIGVFALIALIGEGMFASMYNGFAMWLKPDTKPQILSAALNLAYPDVLRVMGLTVLMCALVTIAMWRKIPAQVLAALFIVVLLVDLYPVNKKLVSFTPKSYRVNLFSPEGVVRKLTSDKDKFRIHTLDNSYRAANWWSYFGLESTSGYFGAKMAGYQKLLSIAKLESYESVYHHPRILNALNVRYIISGFPLDQVFKWLGDQGYGEPTVPAERFTSVVAYGDRVTQRSAYVYRNPGELPRARLVGEYRVIENIDSTLNEMVNGEWEPSTSTLLDRQPSLRIQPGGRADARIVDYRPERIDIKVSTSSPKLLVLADSFYPSGWKAFVDGEETGIMRADGVLRAIAIPEGDHKVEFIFKPKLFYTGLWVSLISLLGLIGLGAYFVFVRKRSS